MHGRERHPVDGRRVAEVGPHGQLGREVGQRRLRPGGAHVVGELGDRGQRLPVLPGRGGAAQARRRPQGQADAGEHVPDRVGQRITGIGGRLAPGGPAEQHQRLADHGPVVEALGAADHVGQAGFGQRQLEPLGVGVDPDQDRDLAGRHARGHERPDPVGHPGRLRGVVGVLGEHRPGPRRALRGQRRGRPDQLVGHGHHLGRGPVVAHQPDHGRAGELRGEPGQVGRGGAGEGVDHLVRVADHAQVVAVAEPRLEQQLLQRVHILELVHDEVPEDVAYLVGRGPAVDQDGGGQLEHGLEVDQVPFPSQLLVGGVDRGQVLGPGRGRTARGRRGGRVSVRADLDDLGPLDLGRGVGEHPRSAVEPDPDPLGRLPDQAGLGVDQLRRPPADHPRPEVVELAQRGRVERGRANLADAQLPEPAAQLARRPHGEGERHHVRRVHRAGQGRVGDPVGDGAGLAGARARQHADWPAGGQSHLALLRVEPGQQRFGCAGHHICHRLILPYPGRPGFPPVLQNLDLLKRTQGGSGCPAS